MKKKIKVAIIGGGINSAVGKAHISALLLSNLYEITGAIFSRDEKINTESKDLYNLSSINLYKDLSDLITNRSDFQFVIVLTPTHTHFYILSVLIKQNINIICEKALVTSLEEGNEIDKLLQISTSKLYVIYNYLGYTMIKYLKGIIQKGELGKINSIHIEMPQEGFIRKNENKPIKIQSWRLEDSNIPTISLDLGVHLHILIHYLTNNKPQHVFATYRNNGNFENIIDDVNALIDYEDAMVCNMWYSKVALGYLNGLRIRLFGEKAGAEWLQSNPDILHVSYLNGNKMIVDKSNVILNDNELERYSHFKPGHPSGFIEALSSYYIDIFDDFNGFSRIKKVFGMDESIEGLNMLEAFSKSFSQSKKIQLV
jgi:predicted dehydrogenase